MCNIRNSSLRLAKRKEFNWDSKCMKDDRLRIPVDKAYLTAIGRATYCFASMEWDAVYCGEKLNPGYVGKVATKTAGMIAEDIVGFAQLITDQGKQARYQTAADAFKRLVKRRNDLVHANPATVGSGQRLVRHGTPWQATEIDGLADDFAACSIELNDLHHHVL
jgi:hypothetical protein